MMGSGIGAEEPLLAFQWNTSSHIALRHAQQSVGTLVTLQDFVIGNWTDQTFPLIYSTLYLYRKKNPSFVFPPSPMPPLVTQSKSCLVFHYSFLFDFEPERDTGGTH